MRISSNASITQSSSYSLVCSNSSSTSTSSDGGMKMLGGETEDLDEMAEMQFSLLDTNKDGLISQEEFVDGLSKNYNLRLLMSPFS